VAQELRWVEENVLKISDEAGSLSKREKRVEDCQTFVMTVPKPQSPGRKANVAPRECSTYFYMHPFTQLLGSHSEAPS
jgi:hypothetical protein